MYILKADFQVVIFLFFLVYYILFLKKAATGYLYSDSYSLFNSTKFQSTYSKAFTFLSR